MEILKLRKQINNADYLRSQFYNEWSVFIDYDCDGFDAQTGHLIFRFRKGVLSGAEKFWGLTKTAVTNSTSRESAGGGSVYRSRLDNKASKTTVSKTSNYNGIVGFLDPAGHFPFCRRTMFTREYFDTRWKDAIFYPQLVGERFKELIRARWEAQMKMARRTNQNYLIPGTPFTTVTINKNFRTAIHKDKGDYIPGFGNISVYRKGIVRGGYFLLPQWGVAIDIDNDDLLLVDVHQWHGNAPLDLDEGALRISFVMYYRHKMYRCPSPTNELKRLKNLPLP